MERRVVVTGMGGVCSVGNDVETIWQSLLAGRSGIEAVESDAISMLRCRICGLVKNLDLSAYLDEKSQRRLDPYCHLAIVAGEEAYRNSGLADSDLDPMRAGVLVSSGMGGMHTIECQAEVAREKGLHRVSPLLVPMMIANMGSGYLSMRYNFMGPNFGVVSACASGLHSIGEAYWIIRRGDADVMMTGAAESSSSLLGRAGFANMRAMSEHNEAPHEACRPFDLERDGFVPGEGAGVLILEEEEHARKRGARILAEVVGYGLTSDAHHVTAPREDAKASTAAIVNALRLAQLPAEAVDYINAHGTSTPMNDKVETLAIKQALGEHAYHTAISSTKSMTGHALGASGALESIFCIKSIVDGVMAPTINLHTPDPDCDLDYIPNEARKGTVNVALNLSFGFGGHNCAVLFKRY